MRPLRDCATLSSPSCNIHMRTAPHAALFLRASNARLAEPPSHLLCDRYWVGAFPSGASADRAGCCVMGAAAVAAGAGASDPLLAGRAVGPCLSFARSASNAPTSRSHGVPRLCRSSRSSSSPCMMLADASFVDEGREPAPERTKMGGASIGTPSRDTMRTAAGSAPRSSMLRCPRTLVGRLLRAGRQG